MGSRPRHGPSGWLVAALALAAGPLAGQWAAVQATQSISRSARAEQRAEGALAQAAAAGSRGQRDAGGQRDDDVPKCSCDCCTVAGRRPEEVPLALTDVRVKCVPSDEHGPEVCSDQCAPADDDAILGRSARELRLETLRFCFFECKPADGVVSMPQAQCVALEGDEAQRVIDRQGNAMDPAFLYARPTQVLQVVPPCGGSAALLAEGRTHAAVASSSHQAPPAPAPAPAPAAGPNTGALGAVGWAMKGLTMAKTQEKEAREEAQRLRRVEAAKKVAAGADPMAMVEDISDAVAGSRSAAQAAAISSRKAGAAMQAARDQSWTSALGAATLSVQRLREEARSHAAEAVGKPRTWASMAAESAAEAARPYLRTVRQAQQMAEQWQVTAQDENDKAAQLHDKAWGLRAAALQEAGLAGCRWRQTANCNLLGRREPQNDKSCDARPPQKQSGFCDCNGNDMLDADEKGYGCDYSPKSCYEMCSIEVRPAAIKLRQAQDTEKAAQVWAKSARTSYATAQQAVRSANGWYAIARQAAHQAPAKLQIE